ncbi:MAG: PH domain-containing protein, partial [Planctomycetota bacterium]
IPTGEDVAVESTAPHDPVLLRASLSQLALYGMLSLRGLLAVPVIIGTYYQFQPDEWFDVRALRRFYPDASMLSFSWLVAIALAIGGLLLIGIASAIWFVARFYGYQLRRNGEDLQVSFGLITKVSATVPRGRIQFISVQQNLWARWLGLANIRIETAGGSTGEGVDPAASVARRWFIPVVSVSEIPRLLNELRDDLGQQWVETPWQSTSPRTLRRLLFVAALESALVTLVLCFFSWFWGVLVGLAVFLLLAFRSYRYSNSLRIYCGDGRVAYRQGLWTKRSSVTFADKLQTARLQQSLFDRRWGMASLAIDTAGAGPAEHRIHIVYLDQADASRMQRLISRGATEAGFSG